MIDKNKAYRFGGDSERWEHVTGTGWFPSGDRSHSVVRSETFEHLHERGILLEYPELPGEDWEFCDEKCGEAVWDEDRGWVNRSYVTDCEDGIYCRKKKPVYESGCCTIIERTLSGQPFPDEVPIYWTTDPEKGKELLK